MKTTHSFAFHPRVFVVLSCFLALEYVSVLHAQSQAITGDLSISGSLDISGPVFNLGTWTNNSTRLGLNVTYSEDASHTASLSFNATRPITRWQWMRAASATDAASVPQMTLNSANALTLYDVTLPTPNATIILDPVAGATFLTSVTVDGFDNQMPNQELSNDASILTLGLADNRYVLRDAGDSLSIGFAATASGLNATALGAYTSATGTESTALSYGATASGQDTVALGNGSIASGLESTALGVNSAATGQDAVTIGFGSLASGFAATTLGNGSRATAAVSTAIGAYSFATGQYSTTLGHYSVADVDHASALGVYSHAHGDYSTALGFASQANGIFASALGAYSTANGIYSAALGHNSISNGMGSVSLGWFSRANGDVSASAGSSQADSTYQFALGRYNLTGGNPTVWVPADDLFTVGNGSDDQHRSNALSVKKNGDTTVGGTLTVSNKIVANGPIIIQPQGDLSMGEFTAQPSPAP